MRSIGSAWKTLGGDVNWTDHGGTWYVRVRDTSRFHVIEFINMVEACGIEEGEPPYVVELSEVDIESPQRKSALDSCGMTEEDVENDLAVVHALHMYGAKAPLWHDSGTNAHKLLREAGRESRRLLHDAAAYEEAMHSRPVNRIGSTAAEYAAGDFDSALGRGLEAGNPEAELMVKIQGGLKS
jgi:hypothetical protein